jgi:hypothetical protein
VALAHNGKHFVIVREITQIKTIFRLIPKLYVPQKLFPFNVCEKGSVSYNVPVKYLFQTFNVVATCKFSIYYPVDFFYRVQISTNHEKIILKLGVILSITLARPGTVMSVVLREITCILKMAYNFRIKSGMCERCIILISTVHRN